MYVNLKKLWAYLTTDQKKSKPVAGKHFDQDTSTATGKRKLTTPIILFILINSILGSSLFYLPGLGVISSGAASLIAWAALFIIAVFVMLYIGELITMHPTSGGTYEFCKRAYGRFGSFMAGWMIWIAGNFGMALSIVAAAEYFIPQQSQSAFLLRMAFAAIWIIVLNFMAYRGIDAGVTMLVTFGIIATVVVTIMTIPSFIDIPALFSGVIASPFQFIQPFFQHEGASIIAYLGLSLLFISEAFLGFEVVSYMANEVKEPKKLHRTLILGMVISGGIMLLYVFSSLGTVAYGDYVSDARPFAVQALNTMGTLGQTIVVFGMYLAQLRHGPLPVLGCCKQWQETNCLYVTLPFCIKNINLHIEPLFFKHLWYLYSLGSFLEDILLTGQILTEQFILSMFC
jgi:amino acid transporter